MRAIDLIVIHCSSTRENYALTEQALEASHRLIGFDGTGYHFYVRRDGRVLATRPVSKVGAHARGYNAHSIGICYEGAAGHTWKSTSIPVGWTVTEIRKIRGQSGSDIR